MNVYTNVGRPIQWPILGSPLGIFVTDVGILNQVVLWWRFDSMADRKQEVSDGLPNGGVVIDDGNNGRDAHPHSPPRALIPLFRICNLSSLNTVYFSGSMPRK